MKPALLILVHLPDELLSRIREHYDVHYAPAREARAAAVAEAARAGVRAVLTNGATGFRGDEMRALPALELVCAISAGYENIDLDTARSLGIALANGAGTNAECVADHAFALLLAATRSLRMLDAHTRAGGWRDELPPLAHFSGRRLGIVGLGAIGRKIARRAQGFDLEVGYHNRRRVEDAPHAYFGSVAELAAWADYLVVLTPGGAATHHMIDAAVLRALGPRGVLVNAARGSVVDTAALATALRDGTIAGAGLDVYESEPAPPTELLELENLILTPHVGGASPQAMQAALQRFLDNAARHFAGQPMVSPIPV